MEDEDIVLHIVLEKFSTLSIRLQKKNALMNQGFDLASAIGILFLKAENLSK